MAVYYKFKSAKDYDSIPMDGPFLSVGTLKEKIFESKHLGRGTDFDLVVTNAQTNEEYLDEAMLIPKNTSVLIRRVPGRPRMTIVTEQEPKVESKMDDPEPEKSSFPVSNASTMKYPEDSEWDEFGNDLYAIPEVLPVQSNNPVPEALPTNKADEDSKIKALIDTPALDWQRQGPDGFAHGRGFGRGGMGGRMGGRGFGFERKTPPQGYVCHRCKVPGHFIQPCPDGSYALPSGAVAVLRPNEAAFEREIEGLPSTRSVGELPPELHCPLCKDVMKDAVLTLYCAVFRASVIDFFTTKPYAFEPSSLPKYPPSKEMDAKLRDEEARRLRATSKANPDGVRRSRQRDRAMRGIPAPEANAELQANLDLADLTGELMWLAIGRISEGELEFAEKICRFVRDIYRELTLLVPHMDDSYDMKTKMDTMLQSVMKIENVFPV